MIRQFFAVCLTALLAVPALAQSPARAYQEPNTGIVFPGKLGPMHYRRVVNYTEQGRPDLGISVRYALPDSPVRADIYLYDLGKKNLGTGIGSPEVATIFQQSIGDIYSLEQRGDHKDVRKLFEGKTTVKTSTGSLVLLHAGLSYSQSPAPQVFYTGPQISNLYLTAFKDFFLKIRFSYPDDARRAQHEKTLEQFLADLGKIL
jgi:hypothetical protein